MNKRLRAIAIIASITVTVFGAVFGAIGIINTIEIKKKERQEMEDKKHIMQLYQKANYSIMYATGYDHMFDSDGVYKKPEAVDSETNKYGIDWKIYINLKYYERETGIVLGYETIVDYFSQEFESDGSLRLYNNGLHPEMEAYIDWFWGKSEDADNYRNNLIVIYGSYHIAHEEEGFEYKVFYSLSPQMYDELAKKEADPNYEMDLLSLQQQGY